MFFLRSFFRFLLPSGLLCLGAGYLQFIAGVPPLLDPYLPLYPWLVTTIGLLLAWRFNRSRVIYVILLMVAGGWVLDVHPEGSFRVFAASPLALLLPLNMAFIAFWKERGLLCWWSLVRLAWLGGQAAGVWWLFQWNAAQVTRWLEWPFLPWSLPDWIGMAQVALCLGLLCAVLLLGRFLSFQKPMDSGFFWALLALLAAFIQEGQVTFWFSTTILILLVAVIEASFSMAFNDELTGLPARRAMNEYLMKLGRRYVVAMVDVENSRRSTIPMVMMSVTRFCG